MCLKTGLVCLLLVYTCFRQYKTVHYCNTIHQHPLYSKSKKKNTLFLLTFRLLRRVKNKNILCLIASIFHHPKGQQKHCSKSIIESIFSTQRIGQQLWSATLFSVLTFYTFSGIFFKLWTRCWSSFQNLSTSYCIGSIVAF